MDGRTPGWRMRLALVALAILPPIHAPAAADAEPALRVDGTAFVLRTADGRVLRGAELAGATLQLGLADGGSVSVRLDSIVPDPEDPELLRHDFRALGPDGRWQAVCPPTLDGEAWGFPIALPPGHPGHEGEITLTCVSGAVGKCARFGYRPWARGPQGENLAPHHAACVRMVRGDYCGDDRPHTREGTLIDIYDDAGIQRAETQADDTLAFEAGWSPQGATCVARTRWPDLVDLDTLHAQCPRLAQTEVCTEAHARTQGALLFNRSKLSPSEIPGEDLRKLGRP